MKVKELKNKHFDCLLLPKSLACALHLKSEMLGNFLFLFLLILHYNSAEKNFLNDNILRSS